MAASDDGDACVVRGHGVVLSSLWFQLLRGLTGLQMYPTPCSLAKFDLGCTFDAKREWEQLLSQFNLGCPLSPLVLRWFSDGGDVGVIAEVFAQGAAEDSHASAVNDANARETSEEGAVKEAFNFGLGLIGGAADHIDL